MTAAASHRSERESTGTPTGSAEGARRSATLTKATITTAPTSELPYCA
jgi:hypothetical protein